MTESGITFMELATVFKDAGIAHTDHSVPGYKNRTFTPVGMVWHHTASPAGNMTLPHKLFTHGRQGLPGPVVHLGLDRQAGLHLYSNGYCNHVGRCSATAVKELAAGKASSLTAAERGLTDTRWFSGNKRLYGLEIDLNGVGETLTPEVLAVAIKATAAIFHAEGWDAGHLSDHKGVTGRKIDVAAPNWPAWSFIREAVTMEIGRLARPPVRHLPHHDPAWVMEPIVSDLACPTGGVWLLGNAGGVYAYGGAPYLGRLPVNHEGQPARLKPDQTGAGYVIDTTLGETHQPKM